MKDLIRILKNEEGVTAIEYGLIAAGIGVAIAIVVGTVGDELVSLFDFVVEQLQTVTGGGGGGGGGT